MLTDADIEQAIETQYALQYGEGHRKDYSILLHLGLAMTGSYEDAQDAVQAVYLNMLKWKKPPSDYCRNQLAYMCGAVIKESFLIYRKQKRRKIADVRIEDLNLAIGDGGLDEDTLDRLRQALAEIKDEWAEILALHHVDNLPVKEIAEKIGKSQGMVLVGMFRARRKLRKLMKAPGETK